MEGYKIFVRDGETRKLMRISTSLDHAGEIADELRRQGYEEVEIEKFK